MRLTVMYSSLFLATGTTLLTIAYLLVRRTLREGDKFHRQSRQLAHALSHGVQRPLVPNGHSASQIDKFVTALYDQAANSALHRLAIEYIIVLVLVTALSVVAGWLLAGRALAPLRSIIATARRVSGENLGERIALAGPTDELRELADTFDGMLERLDAAFASQRHFVADASHELRTPLAIMRTEIDVALADPDASVDDLREMADVVVETIDRSEALIASLLALARSESGQVNTQTVDLDQTVRTALANLRGAAAERSLTIAEHLDSIRAAGDPALLERMTTNLLQNAVIHNRDGGAVSVATRQLDGSVELRIENDGVRLEPDHVDELTRPFRRLDRSVPGFGVGLSLASSIVHAHHGRLELAAREQGGLLVLVTLPAATGVEPSGTREPLAAS
jgi:signal transduction histidine kinase